jgi:Fur family ferric uptake transcriptional regulator
MVGIKESVTTQNDYAGHLRDAGLRVTRPRLLVLNLLHSTPGHHSADDIVALLTDQSTPLPRASVYNVASALVDCGLVTMVSVGPGSARYEYGAPWHHHFVCKICGAIQDVRCILGKKPCLDPDDIAGDVEEAHVTFRGTCDSCRSAIPA